MKVPKFQKVDVLGVELKAIDKVEKYLSFCCKTSLLSYNTIMKLEWTGNGTLMEFYWNWTGTELELYCFWNINVLELNWNFNGTNLEL